MTPTYDEIEFAEVETPSVLAAQVDGKSSPDPASIGKAIHSAFGELAGYIGRHGLRPSGQPRAIYNSYGPEGVSFTLALPVASAPSEAGGQGPAVGPLPGGKTYRFTHRGPYGNLAQTYNRITAFMKSKGLMQTEADWAKYTPMWEEYQNDPEKTPESDLVTYIYLPVG